MMRCLMMVQHISFNVRFWPEPGNSTGVCKKCIHATVFTILGPLINRGDNYKQVHCYRACMARRMFWCLLVFVVVFLPGIFPYATPPTYRLVSSTLEQAPSFYPAEWTISTVSDVDDGPFEELTLPFTFPFAGKLYNKIWLGPNGGLHMVRSKHSTPTFHLPVLLSLSS
jgi:hypothetical protein